MIANKKILYIITKSEIGGAQSHVLDLLQGMHALDLHLATSAEGPLTEAAREKGVPVHLIKSMTRQINPFADGRCVSECANLIRRIKPNLIHAHSSKAGLIARLAGRICHTPTVFTAHGWAFSSHTPPLRRLIALLSERLTAPLAEKIVCVSETDRQLALRHGVGNRDTLTTIHYGIDAERSPRAEPCKTPAHFVMVARFNEQKDQSTLLRAFARLNSQEARLSLVGSGPLMEQCKAYAQSQDLGDKVSFLGDRYDVPDLLAQASCFVLSTHYEGLPISIIEAMRAGLPVVATDVSGISEEVTHGQTGLLVPHRDEQALLQALQTMAASPEMRQKMGEAGRQKFLREFTLDRMLLQVDAVYERVLASRSGAAVRQLGRA